MSGGTGTTAGELPWFHRKPGAHPLVVAHRGGSGLAPENTMAAFQSAVALGVDVIEFDLRQTSEGFPVVFHDETLDRLTNEKGLLRDWRWAGLQRSVKVCSTEKIPLLEEICARLKSHDIRLFVEIKEPELAKETVAVLEQTGWRGRAVVGGFSRQVVEDVTRSGIFPAIQLLKSSEVRDFFSSLQPRQELSHPSANLVGLAVADTTPARVRALQSSGFAAWVWTANTKEEILHTINCGADAVISDHPDLCKSLLCAEV
jgi:glycerophosphoryl diester phosphodiesterase